MYSENAEELAMRQELHPEHFRGSQLQETVTHMVVDVSTATECRDIEHESVVDTSGISTADAASD